MKAAQNLTPRQSIFATVCQQAGISTQHISLCLSIFTESELQGFLHWARLHAVTNNHQLSPIELTMGLTNMLRIKCS